MHTCCGVGDVSIYTGQRAGDLCFPYSLKNEGILTINQPNLRSVAFRMVLYLALDVKPHTVEHQHLTGNSASFPI